MRHEDLGNAASLYPGHRHGAARSVGMVVVVVVVVEVESSRGFIYYDAAKQCVMRTSGMLPPYILATVTEPPEV